MSVLGGKPTHCAVVQAEKIAITSKAWHRGGRLVVEDQGAGMRIKITAFAVIGCLTLQACSSRPRDFSPTLATPTASRADFDTAYATCHQLLVVGKLNSSGRSSSLGAGAKAGAGTAAVGGTAAAMA